jgi:tRNA threonylcarbamoyladenosine biosynthesis protein TsaB
MAMKILAVDTATKSCSVAIIDAGSLSAELTTQSDQTHSKHLMQRIDAVLGMADLSAVDLDGLAVTLGPGSFTGLRIGISTIKGLAYALDKPVVGISSLNALAWQCADRSFLICPLLDARKGEVYFATYRFDDGTLASKSTERATPPEVAVQNIKEPCVFIGSGAQVYRQNIIKALGDLAHFAPHSQNIIRASSVAFLSLKRFETSDTDELASLVPCYIRKSDAELNYGKRPTRKAAKPAE